MTADAHATCAANFSQSIANISNELIEAGLTPEIVANAVANALGKVLAQFTTPEQAGAMLRVQAAAIERSRAPVAGIDPTDQETIELTRMSQVHIDNLLSAGIPENVAVTTIVNAAIERVARTRGVAGAAGWLSSLSEMVLRNAAAIEGVAAHR